MATQDEEGNLYGTTGYGGTYGAGVVFELDRSSNETVLYSFTGGVDGGYPYDGVIRDERGNLYGTLSGGALATPSRSLVQDERDNLNGTTPGGGSSRGPMVP